MNSKIVVSESIVEALILCYVIILNIQLAAGAEAKELLVGFTDQTVKELVVQSSADVIEKVKPFCTYLYHRGICHRSHQTMI